MLTQREFGERLKATRKKLKLTQKTISEEINVGQGTLSQWEQGLLNPSLLSVAQFCEAFDLSLDDLLGLKKTPNRSLTPTRSPSPSKQTNLNGC